DITVMQSIDLMAFASSNKHDSTVTLQCTIRGFAGVKRKMDKLCLFGKKMMK
ncbi:hypothetical protein M9458_037477, partial [Cirrhinus mrigala]